MRNLFLMLVLANVFLLAWHFWVDPVPAVPPGAAPPGLTVFSQPVARPATAPGRPASLPVSPTASAAPVSECLRVGPWSDGAAAQQAGERLAARGVQAVQIARDAQLWLGHWVQINGFESAAAAEAARQRLVAGGLADAYLMQDGARPMLSLGVFRERGRADQVAATARRLGYEVDMRDRYRPAVEQWLLIRPRVEQQLKPVDLRLGDDRILRLESTPCEAASDPGVPGSGLPAPGTTP